MYTIKWVAEQLGLAPGTLRAWEQRYGIVHPTRSDGGYRLYSETELDALRMMAGLVDSGMQPAQAAEQVRSGIEPTRRDIEGNDGAPPGFPEPATLIAASRAYDVRALEDTLDSGFAAASFELVVDTWLMTAMRQVGEAWETGVLDIAQEHFISAGVMRRLAAAFDAAGHASGGHLVVVGLVPGATHEIAALAFATMLRRAGVRVTYLGPDLPVRSWAKAVRTTRPDAVVIAAPRSADALAATEVVDALGQAETKTRVFVGGPGAAPENALGGTDSLALASDWLTETLNHS